MSGLGQALFEAALRLYPRSFRERHGAEMRRSFRVVLESGHPGWVLRAWRWIAGLSDLVRGAVRERGRRAPPQGTRAQVHADGRGTMQGSWLRDVRYAVRSLAREPVFALVAAGSLAVGIGATTAVFSVADAVPLRPLPGIPTYDRVVELGRSHRGEGFDTFAYPDFVDLREAILEADPSLSLGPVVSLERYTSVGILPQRIAAALTSGLGLLALLLSGLGIYGVISFAVGRQRREIGIRMALGESRRSVIARFVRSGVWVALPGMAVGGVLAVLGARVLGALLLDLSPHDPIALGGMSLLLLGVVVMATWLPARRAARVDPARSLRVE